jgi:GMP synthase-like glutamine amidotransferase
LKPTKTPQARLTARQLTSLTTVTDLREWWRAARALVGRTLPALHGDVVVKAGEPMDTIASVDGYEHFATRHAEAPIWTTQYHPEFTGRLRERIAQDIGWHENHLSFEAVTATRTLVNFAQLVERYGQ